MDGVTLTLETGDGQTHYGSFTIDDYDKREASGDLGSYLEKRAWPKIRAEWPDARETGRKITRGLPGKRLSELPVRLELTVYLAESERDKAAVEDLHAAGVEYLRQRGVDPAKSAVHAGRQKQELSI
jgi:hypothetical protein